MGRPRNPGGKCEKVTISISPEAAAFMRSIGIQNRSAFINETIISLAGNSPAVVALKMEEQEIKVAALEELLQKENSKLRTMGIQCAKKITNAGEVEAARLSLLDQWRSRRRATDSSAKQLSIMRDWLSARADLLEPAGFRSVEEAVAYLLDKTKTQPISNSSKGVQN